MYIWIYLSGAVMYLRIVLNIIREHVLPRMLPCCLLCFRFEERDYQCLAWGVAWYNLKNGSRTLSFDNHTPLMIIGIITIMIIAGTVPTTHDFHAIKTRNNGRLGFVSWLGNIAAQLINDVPARRSFSYCAVLAVGSNFPALEKWIGSFVKDDGWLWLCH